MILCVILIFYIILHKKITQENNFITIYILYGVKLIPGEHLTQFTLKHKLKLKVNCESKRISMEKQNIFFFICVSMWIDTQYNIKLYNTIYGIDSVITPHVSICVYRLCIFIQQKTMRCFMDFCVYQTFAIFRGKAGRHTKNFVNEWVYTPAL